MARKTDIRLRRSAVSGSIPTTSNLNLGELALNTADGKVYMKKSVGGVDSIVEVGSGAGISASFDAYEYSSSSNQTTFSGTDNNGNTLAYNTGSPSKVQVYMNGILLDEGSSNDYTATNGTSVVLTTAATTGDIIQIHAYKSDINIVNDLSFEDNQKLKFGDGDDLKLYHSGNHSYVQADGTGDLYIENLTQDEDIIMRINDGGSMKTMIFMDGNTALTKFQESTRHKDGKNAGFGDSDDLMLYHNGTNSFIKNATNDLYILNEADDKDIMFQADNGSGGNATYFQLDGSQEQLKVHKNMVFFDDVKAYFGGGADLGIWHDGSNSYIADTGTGNLFIRGENNVVIENNSGSNYFEGTSGGASRLYFAGNERLTTSSAGTDFTGNVTVNVNSASTTFGNHDAALRIDNTNATANNWASLVFDSNNGSSADISAKYTDHTNNYADLYFSNRGSGGYTAKMVILQNGYVGIGTTNPGTQLEINSDGSYVNGAELLLKHANNNSTDIISTIKFANNAGSAAMIQAGTTGANNTGYIGLHTDNAGTSSEKMRISGAGEVGIGTTSPQTRLHVESSDGSGIRVSRSGASAYMQLFPAYSNVPTIMGFGAGGLHLGYNSNTAGIRIATNNNVGIGTTAPSELLHVKGTNGAIAIDGNGSSNTASIKFINDNERSRITSAYDSGGGGRLTFHTDTTGGSLLERLRINNAGNVGIGTTSPDAKLEVAGGSTGIILSNAGDSSAYDAVSMTYNGYNSGTPEFVFQPKTVPGSGTVNSYFRFKSNTSSGSGTNVANVSIDGGLSVTGNTTIDGNLTVNGTQTVLNTATLTVDDLNITVADGAANSSAADGAGLTVAGAGASLAWNHGNQQFRFNKDVFTSLGFVIGTTATNVGKMYNSSGVMALEAYSSRSISFGNATNGEHVRIDANGNVGIGTNSPGSKLHVYDGNIQIQTPSGSGGRYISLDNTHTGGRDYRLISTNDSHGSLGGGDFAILDNDVSGNDAAKTRLLIDSSGKVGIGTTSPANLLSVESTGQFAGINIKSASSNGISYLDFGDADDNNIGGINYDNSTDTLQLRNGNAHHVFLKTDGKVGIGTGSPGTKLHINSGTSDVVSIFESTDTYADIRLKDNDGSSYIRNAQGNLFLQADREDAVANTTIRFHIDDSEKARITDGGYLLVGKTDTSFTTNGTEIRGGNLGARVIRQNAEPLTLHRRSSDGAILNLYKDSASVGNIGTYNADLHIGTGDTGIGFNDNGRAIIPMNTSTPAFASALISLGTSSVKFKDIHLSGVANVGGGIIHLGTADSSSGHLNAKELMTFNIDTDNDDTNRYFAFYKNGESGSGTELMRLTEDGSLGIGETSPDGKLHIKGGTATGDLSHVLFENTQGSKVFAIGGGASGVTNNNLFFRNVTDNTTPMVITDAGNVGIGTTSPGAALHIGSAGHLLFDRGGEVRSKDTSGNIKTIARVDSSNRLQYGWSGNGAVLFMGGGSYTERMRIHTNGNIGIGTTTPASKLSVADSNGAGLEINPQTSNDRVILFAYDRGASTYQTMDFDATDFHFNPNGTEKMRLKSNGFLGIGTSSPLDLLHLKSSSTDARAVIDGHTDFDAELKFAENGTVKYTVGHDAASDNFVIGTTNVDTGQRLVISSAGNVGIGTTSPANKLHVNGTVKAEGAYYSNVTSGGGAAFVITHSGSEQWSMDARNGSSSTDYVDFGIAGGTRCMTWQDDGKVGIGTNAPSAPLEVVGSDSGIKITSAASDRPHLSLVNGTSEMLRLSANNVYAAIGDSSNSQRYMVFKSGNVGINNTNPTAKFHLVDGNNSAQFGDLQGNSTMSLRMADTSTQPVEVQAYGSELRFNTATSSGSTPSVKMNILANGKVGIGNTSPLQLLSVGGIINSDASDDYYGAWLSGNSASGQDNYLGLGPWWNNAGYIKFIQSGSPHRLSIYTHLTGDHLTLQEAGGKVGVGTTSPASKFQVGHGGIDVYAVNTSATSAAQVDTFSASTFRSARFTVQITNTTDDTYQITEILLIHDGTTPAITEYGTIFTGSAREASFDADIVSGNVRLLATPASTDTMQFKVVRHSILV